MSSSTCDILLAAFTAESLALGAHWEYDQGRIAGTLGQVRELLAPTLNTYHPGKKAGDLSHYGDQALWLLRFVKEHGRFDRNLFAARWREQMRSYTGYMDHASKNTIANMDRGVEPQYFGATSKDFAGPVRFLPLLLIHPLKAGAEPSEALLADAQAQTLVTHNSPMLANIAAYFVRTLQAVVNGSGIAAAFAEAAEVSYGHLTAREWLSVAESHLNEEPGPAVQSMGQACEVPGAMQSTLYLAEKYENDPVEGLVQNVMVGGDSCGRGFMLGALFGARHGVDWIPASWSKTLAAGAEIRETCGG